jgi:dynein heavy chain, axonemal
MVILFDLQDDDWNAECTEVVEHWLEELSERLLIIYFVGNTLTASVTFPLKPVSDMCYFMRNLKHTFSVENFHDEVTFGTLGEDLEGTLLQMTNDVIVPLLLDKPWPESIKTTFFEAMHSFLGNLTQIHYKLSGLTILYIPREKVDPSAPRKNSLLVKRLENVVAQWTSQIRMCLNDTEQTMPEEILCLTDEYDFWNYKSKFFKHV